MAGELNSVQESIKLALDAADAATDVTSEYSQVKREHKKLESKVSQIHRYTTITFVSAISAAVIALAFSATLYFKSISELKLMTSTNREGLIVFSENIERLNTVLAELQVSLSKQEELVKLNRESTSQISELKKVMADGSASIVAQLQKTGDGMGGSTIALGEDLKTALAAELAIAITDQAQKADYFRALTYGSPGENCRGGRMREAMNIDSRGQSTQIVEDYSLIEVRQ